MKKVGNMAGKYLEIATLAKEEVVFCKKFWGLVDSQDAHFREISDRVEKDLGLKTLASDMRKFADKEKSARLSTAYAYYLESLAQALILLVPGALGQASSGMIRT